MSKHTPGPWVYAPYIDEATGEYARVTAVARCCDYVIGLSSAYPGGNYRDGAPSGDPEADTRLIAAAPELLEALQAIVNTRHEHFIDHEVDGMREWDARARAAIAKAIGGEA